MWRVEGEVQVREVLRVQKWRSLRSGIARSGGSFVLLPWMVSGVFGMLEDQPGEGVGEALLLPSVPVPVPIPRGFGHVQSRSKRVPRIHC